VFADIVQVTLDRANDHRARGFDGFLTVQERPEDVSGASCCQSGDQHFRDEEFTIPHAAPDFIHGRYDCVGKELVGLDSLLQPSLGQFLGERGLPIDYCLLQLLKDTHFTLLSLAMSLLRCSGDPASAGSPRGGIKPPLPQTTTLPLGWKCQFLYKNVLETWIGVERHVLDEAANASVRPVLGVEAEQGKLCSQKRRVACGFDPFGRKIDQANALRAGTIDVVAKSPRQIEAGKFLRTHPLHKKLYSSGDGSFGELKFANVILGEGDRRGQHPTALAVRESPGSCDHPEFQSRCHGVYQTAPAQAAWSAVSDDVAAHPVAAAPPLSPLLTEEGNHRHLRNCPGGSAHTHGNLGAFKSRTRCRRRAKQSVLVPNHNLTVGSQINKSDQVIVFSELGGQNTGQ